MFSCNTINNLKGNSYTYKSYKRTLILSFYNDSTCSLKNIFNCRDLDLRLRETTITARYNKIGDTLYLKNVDCKSDACSKPLTVSYPLTENKDCFFLSANSKKRNAKFGPNYKSEFEKFAIVPNIDIDTLYIIKNKLILYKREGQQNIGFIFK
jgi:hypothetical protein